VRSHLSAEIKANEIRMLRSNPSNKFLSFLIVEGEGDAKFYKRFIDDSKCEINIANGKEKAIELVKILERSCFLGILAIVDADFDLLEGKLPSSPNILLTDTHDLETLLLRSPALEKLLIEYGSKEKLEKKLEGRDVRAILLENGKPIGYLRWVSLRDKIALTFENLDFGKFLDKKTLTLNLQLLVKTVKDKSNRPDLLDLQDKIEQLKCADHDAWHVCCGHDLICILSEGLRHILGSNDAKDVKEELLEKSLRLAYEEAYFSETKLFLALQNWEKAHQPFALLRD